MLGLTYRDIAALLDVPEGTAKSRVHLARRRPAARCRSRRCRCGRRPRRPPRRPRRAERVRTARTGDARRRTRIPAGPLLPDPAQDEGRRHHAGTPHPEATHCSDAARQYRVGQHCVAHSMV
ncbi:sigma factor-like helix-turn-helix DNA-binding protein [Micromonospora sp. NPDC047548]|uniref:sigma factor-like helix-turn-helix DNA-binding protein n=1 Tax=Micromonospora sp. NPDC047548 TaxID=3155624 RepID=UPI0033D85C94